MPSTGRDARLIRDFHLHTCYSDGIYTPRELVGHAKEQAVGELAITDHNIVSGLEEGARAAHEAGIALLSGVEMSALYGGREVHILGYGFDPKRREERSPLFAYMDELQAHQHRWLEEVAAHSRENPIVVKTESGGTVQISLTARDLARFSRSIPNGFNLGVLIKEKLERVCPAFRDVPARHVFYFLFWRKEPLFLARYEELFAGHGMENRKYWDVENESPPLRPPEEVIAMLRMERALPVIAHPAEMKIGEGEIAELSGMGLGGVEVYTPKHGQAQAAFYEGLADRHGLLRTSGTDYHDPFWRAKADFGRDREGRPLTSGAGIEAILQACSA